ncbi:MAG TPA: LytS/YhcK type 5TM receptor domain-containing protein [Candidatus Limnocylindria bacterium]|nr:LytS/YhcK type 5TM receptor domain-containing protein [Candidatus Limnocylindria bacterium]
MDYHHVVEAAGVVSLGLVYYSFTYRWFEEGPPARRRWRPVINGLAFGLLAVVLMISRIHVGDGQFVDARAVPIALIALVEAGAAGWLAAAVAVLYRIWLGGPGAVAGVLGIVATAGAAVAVRRWAAAQGGLAFRHSMALGAAVFVITWASFLLLGTRGAALFASVWLPFLVMSLVGIGVGARLFADVVASYAAETARRDAAQLRAVMLLAQAAAHEINNPLTAVMGGLGIVARRLPPATDEAQWIQRALDASQHIADIVKRMNRITQLEEVPTVGSLPPMLDIRKSSS